MENWDLSSVLLFISAITTMIVTIIASISAAFIANNSNKKADKNLEKTEEVMTKTVEIHQLANSNLTKMTQSLEDANKRILALEKMLSSMVDRRNPPTGYLT
jgi:Na+-translocating ferredoxin:NAD+ oxidoreductase RnfG subunit